MGKEEGGKNRWYAHVGHGGCRGHETTPILLILDVRVCPET